MSDLRSTCSPRIVFPTAESPRDAYGDSMKSCLRIERDTEKLSNVFDHHRSPTPSSNGSDSFAHDCGSTTPSNIGSSDSPRRRRKLPSVPSSRRDGSMSPPNRCPFYCTAEILAGFKTCVQPDCGIMYCGACLHSQYGPMVVYADSQPVYKCANCHKNPMAIEIELRPKWDTDDSKSQPGLPIPPPLLAEENFFKSMKHDAPFVLSLRVPEETKSSPVNSSSESKALPEVFGRLTDFKRYPARHRNRFDYKGDGLGLEGTKDDTRLNVLIAGQATITRSLDPELDSPSKPFCSYELEEQLNMPSLHGDRRRSSPRIRSSNSSRSQEVFDRLSRPSSRTGSTRASNDSEYDQVKRTQMAWNLGGRALLNFQC